MESILQTELPVSIPGGFACFHTVWHHLSTNVVLYGSGSVRVYLLVTNENPIMRCIVAIKTQSESNVNNKLLERDQQNAIHFINRWLMELRKIVLRCWWLLLCPPHNAYNRHQWYIYKHRPPYIHKWFASIQLNTPLKLNSKMKWPKSRQINK